MNSIGIQRLATAIIIQAARDLHGKNEKHKKTAIYFFEGNYYLYMAYISRLNNPKDLYLKFKDEKLNKIYII